MAGKEVEIVPVWGGDSSGAAALASLGRVTQPFAWGPKSRSESSETDDELSLTLSDEDKKTRLLHLENVVDAISDVVLHWTFKSGFTKRMRERGANGAAWIFQELVPGVAEFENAVPLRVRVRVVGGV